MEEFDKHIWAISFDETVGKYFPGIDVEKIRQFYVDTFDEFIGKVKKIENVDQILKYLQNKKISLAVVSNTRSNIVEKILEKIGVREYFKVIVGGESGLKARPMRSEWALNIKKQCEQQNIAFFFKQWGTWGGDGIKRNKRQNGRVLNGVVYDEYPELVHD